MKKLVSLILTFALALLPMLACASTDGSSTSDSSSSTTGTATNPSFGQKTPVVSVVHPDFQLTNGFIEPVERQTTAPSGFISISTATEFSKIGLNPSANYILMRDIDLSGSDFTSISTFSGTLEGNGYTVMNAQCPLFLTVDGGTIENLGVDTHLVGNNGTTMATLTFCGIARNLTNSALLFNCWVDGSIQSDNPLASGIALNASDGSTIQSCRNSANVSIATDWSQETICGGIVGTIGKDVSIINCLNEGNLTMDENTPGEQSLGGIVGQLSIVTKTAGCLTQVYNCRNTGALRGRDYVAGIVGYVDLIKTYAAFSLRQCLNEGDAQPAANLSGIVNIHYIEDGTITIMNCANVSTSMYTTGVVGGEFLQRQYKRLSSSMMNVYVECCFNTAPCEQGISSVGKNLNNCYYVGTGIPATADGALFATVKALTEREAAQASSFTGFDFDTVWTMGSTSPHFQQTSY